MSTDIGPLPSPRAVAQWAQDNNLKKTEYAEALYTSTLSKAGIEIDFTRWNKLYPYCLILARAVTTQSNDPQSRTTNYRELARFTLPVAPEQLQIQAPPAIIVTKTLGGVVEEHNGIPFKNIILQGTTGVFPLRSSVIGVGDEGIGGGLLAGTLQAVNQTRDIAVSATQQFTADFFGGKQPKNRDAQLESTALHGTGYAQFRLLRRFLEGYVNAKKVGGSDLRLLFAIFKDEIAYVVTPMAFNLRRDVSSPLRYRYDLQFKAWHEVPSSSLGGGDAGDWDVTQVRSTLTKVLDTLVAAQRVILSAVSVVNAVRADIQKVLNIVRQAILAVKLVVGAVVAIIDLPRQLLQDLEEIVVSSWAMLKNSIYGSGPDSIAGALAAYSTTKQAGTLRGRAYVTPPPPRPLVNQAGIEIPPSALNGIFANPYTKASNDFLSIIMLDNLEIPDALQARIDTEYERVSEFRPADYARMRDEIVETAVSISDTVGASDSQFNSTYNNPVSVTTRTPNLEDFSILFAINDIIGALNELAAVPDVATNSTMDYVAGIAAQSGIAFQTATSKYGVPFPYDTTLEQVSARYLKDPDRWMEIAVLNGLREPYIDEVGFDVPLIANGNLSEIVIGDATNLKINQPVWIQSAFVVREKRHILNINEVAPNNIVVTLDGTADLDKYKIAAHAYIHAFLPDTVNSQQLIYIPSDISVEDNSELAKIPGLNAFDDLLEVGGVDILLTTKNDLTVTNDGDCRLAYGMSALVQRARIALGTPQGTLMRHPTYGLPIEAGQSIADLDVNALATACQEVFTSDPAFDGVSTVSIGVQGPTVAINLGLYVKGQDLPISLAIEVKR
jgi:hypothetical protein